MSTSDELATEEWVSTKTAAEMLGCSESQVYVLGHAGVITHNGASKHRKFSSESIRTYLSLFRSPLAAAPAEAGPDATEQPELPVTEPDDPLTAAGVLCTHGARTDPAAWPVRLVLSCPEGEVAGFGVAFPGGPIIIARAVPYDGLQIINDPATAERMYPGRGSWSLAAIDSDHSGHGRRWSDMGAAPGITA